MKKWKTRMAASALIFFFCGGYATAQEGADTVSLEVFNPIGAVEVTHLHASRLADLKDKTVCLFSVHMWEASRTFPEINRVLGEQYPDAKIIPYEELPNLYGVEKETLAAAVKEHGCDAAILGNAG